MRLVAQFTMRGVLPAIVVTAVFAFLAPMLPPLSLLSTAALGLVTLRRGGGPGMLVLIGSTLACGFMAGVAYGNPFVVVGFVGLLWLPVWMLALVLRATISLPLTLESAAALGAAGLLGVYATLGDPAPVLREQFVGLLMRLISESGGAAPDAGALEQAVAQFTTGGDVAGSLVLTLVLGLLIARWWQAQLYNPGGFRAEFHELRLHKPFAAVLVVVLIGAQLNAGVVSTLAADLLKLFITVYLIHGAAIVHGAARIMQLNVAWLVVFYVMILFGWPLMRLLLPVLAVFDSWIDLRGRLARARGAA